MLAQIPNNNNIIFICTFWWNVERSRLSTRIYLHVPFEERATMLRPKGFLPFPRQQELADTMYVLPSLDYASYLILARLL